MCRPPRVISSSLIPWARSSLMTSSRMYASCAVCGAFGPLVDSGIVGGMVSESACCCDSQFLPAIASTTSRKRVCAESGLIRGSSTDGARIRPASTAPCAAVSFEAGSAK